MGKQSAQNHIPRIGKPRGMKNVFVKPPSVKLKPLCLSLAFALSVFCAESAAQVREPAAAGAGARVRKEPEKGAKIRLRKKVASRDFLKDSAIYYGSIWAFRFFYVRNKNDRIYDTSPSKWWDNITKAPERDDGDQFFTNYVVHPFAGYVSYLYYRQMGYGFGGAAFGSALQSALFEYTVEGLVETPSLPDLISTPGLGVLFGFAAENFSNWLEGFDSPASTFLAHVVNPMRNFVKNGRVALINPLQRRFEYTQSFDISHVPWKNLSVEQPDPLSFQSGIPRGYAGARLEVAGLEGDGQIVFYNLRAEFPSADYRKSVYVIFNQSGVNNLDGGPGDGYELSNFQLGVKTVVLETPAYRISAGFESHLPSIYKDNVGRLRKIHSLYKRDLPVYLPKSYALTPFFGASATKGAFSLEATAGFSFIGKTELLEGDSSETMVRYGAAIGVSVPLNIVRSITAEITGNTFPSLRNGGKNNLYFTQSIRFGSFISPSVGLQLPLSGDDGKYVSKSFIADIQIRF